jgi:hypothetical protein
MLPTAAHANIPMSRTDNAALLPSNRGQRDRDSRLAPRHLLGALTLSALERSGAVARDHARAARSARHAELRSQGAHRTAAFRA